VQWGNHRRHLSEEERQSGPRCKLDMRDHIFSLDLLEARKARKLELTGGLTFFF